MKTVENKAINHPGMKTNKPNGEWYPVRGFENYEISKDGRIRNINGHMLKRSKYNGTYRLVKDKVAYTISSTRMQYAIMRDVDPRDLKGLVIIEEKGELTALTRKEFLLRVNAKFNKPGMTKTTAIRYYKEAILFSQKMLAYYKTGDVTELGKTMASYEDIIKAYMYKSGMAKNINMQNEVWGEIYSTVMTGIMEGTVSIIEPVTYLRRCVRGYFGTLKKYKEKMARYDDSKMTFRQRAEYEII